MTLATDSVALDNEGPWNYSTVRYDFTYAVVPEPRPVLLVGGGLALLMLGRVRPRERKA